MKNTLKTILGGSLRGLETTGARIKRSPLSRWGCGRSLTDAVLWPCDYVKNVQYYRSAFGAPPRVFRARTFNEKIIRAKLINRKKRHIQFADKLAARAIVEEKVGADALANIHWTGTDLLEARAADLPDRFVVKANHGWNTVLLARSAAAFDWTAARPITAGWLRSDHSDLAGEWQYRWIKPRLYIEEFLEGEGGEPPPDYKFFCFHGRVEFLAVDRDRFSSVTRVLHGRNFERLPFGYAYPRHANSNPRPERFEEMIAIAETLSAGEPFLRVDLYDAGRPIFGELTLHPGSGFDPFDPPEWDETFGALI